MDIISLGLLIVLMMFGVVRLSDMRARALVNAEVDKVERDGPAPFHTGRLGSSTVSDSCRPGVSIDRKSDCYAQLYPITLAYVDYKTNHVPPEFAPAPCLA
jgi:hypothetical protein